MLCEGLLHHATDLSQLLSLHCHVYIAVEVSAENQGDSGSKYMGVGGCWYYSGGPQNGYCWFLVCIGRLIPPLFEACTQSLLSVLVRVKVFLDFIRIQTIQAKVQNYIIKI